MWWHLKLGEIIWDSGSLPETDEFSFTTNEHPWVAHQWLAEVSIYLFYKVGHRQMLLGWLCLFGSALVALLYWLCSAYSGNAKVALLGGLIGWFFTTVSLAIRPLILGHIFLVVELLILHFARRRNHRWLWVLPPLFALWVNCHGSFALGLLVLGIFAFCSFIQFQSGLLVSERWEGPARTLLVSIFVLSALALFANPIGVKLVTYPLDLLLKQKDNLGNITEWRSLNFHNIRGVAVFGLAGVMILIVLVRKKVFRLEELLLIVLGLGLAARHQRMMAVFGILAAPSFCRLLADLWRGYDPNRDHRVVNASLMAVATVLVVVGFPTVEKIERQIETANPVGAVDFIRRNSLSGPMLNDYAWGGYLIWAAPEEKVFIDGRADIFDWTGVLGKYLRWYAVSEDPNLLLEEYCIQYCLLRKTARVANVLPYLPGWEKVYEDALSLVFTRTAKSSCGEGTAGVASLPGRQAGRT